MTIIKVFVTRGVTALPLKKNLIPRFKKRGGHTRNNEGCIDFRDKWISGPLEEENFSVSHAAFPFMGGQKSTL
jgi:hypothetical protein